MTSAFTTSPQSTCWWLVAAGNVNDTQYQSTSIMLSVRPLWRWTVWAIPASTILVQPTLQSKLKRVFVRKYYVVILLTIDHLQAQCFLCRIERISRKWVHQSYQILFEPLLQCLMEGSRKEISIKLLEICLLQLWHASKLSFMLLEIIYIYISSLSGLMRRIQILIDRV